jgi:hypothetical protein
MRTTGRDGAGGRHQAEGSLPGRPDAGAALARAHLEHLGPHREPGAGRPDWITDPAILRRVRDALASGGQR